MRNAFRAGGVLLIIVALVGAGKLWSRDKAAPAVPRTRIGLLNLTEVITNYDKYKGYKEAMQQEAAPYEASIKELQAHAAALKKEYEMTGILAGKHEEIEQDLKKVQAEAEKVADDAKKELAKKAEKQMVEIYRHVRAVAESYAKTHDLDLVLQYNAPVKESDRESAANVERLITAGATIPLYAAPGLDISKEIIEALNDPK